MFINGEHGSSDIVPGTGIEPIVPTSGSLTQNVNAPVPGSAPFESFTILAEEGQQFRTALSMTTPGAVSVVFAADPPAFGINWSLSFDGQTLVGGNTTVGIDFSTDGIAYANVASVQLTPVDTLFEVPLGAQQSPVGYVRLNFAPPGQAGIGQARFDHVAIDADVVPEPATAFLLLFGLAGLAGLRQRV
jgi:hypothetical protein